MIDLGSISLIVDRPGAEPAPFTAGPGDPPTVPWPDTGPRVTDPGLHRLAPNADRATLNRLHDDIAHTPPVGPLLADLARAVEHSREVRS